MDKKSILDQLKCNNLGNLLKEADQIRQRHCGDTVFIRGVIDFSNVCVRNCLYCGLRRDNKKIIRYRMPFSTILTCAKSIIDRGIKTIVLQSGDDFFYSRDLLCRIVKSIKTLSGDVAVTLSIGERAFDDYRAFRDHGANRFLLKFETSNRDLYSYLHPGQRFGTRIKRLADLKKLGYQVGTGIIVGLPFQTVHHLADDINIIHALQPEMIALGPFITQSGTPLHSYPSGSIPLTLQTIALTRISNKSAFIPATSALATGDKKNGIYRGLQAGCNVIMPNFTPLPYRKNYLLYDNKKRITIALVQSILSKSKRLLSMERGDFVKIDEPDADFLKSDYAPITRNRRTF